MTEFEYDCRNRLIRAGDTYYEYDAENIRTATETPEYREEYVTDSVGELSRVLVITREYKTESKTETEQYYYGNGLIYEKGSEVGLLVYHFNHLGSTTAVTDESGKLVYAYDYGTYGELVSTTEYSQTKPIIRFLYDGQLGVATDDNGLYYMRSRYYNPEIKRFINQDILTGSICNSNSLNRYSYVEGNPVSYSDPFGLSPFSFLNVFNPSMIVHTALDILGCLPGGAIFDVANAAIYFMEDNETEAWKCVFFAIPGADLVGKGAKWGAKLGGKGGKIVEQTMKSIDFAGHLGSTYFAASDFGNGIAFMIDKYMVGEAEFSSDTVWEFASLAGHGFQLKSFSGSFLNNAKAGNYGSTLMESSTTDLSLNSMFGEGSVFNYFVHDNRGGIQLPTKVKTDNATTLITHRGTNEHIDKVLHQGYIKAYPPRTSIDAIIDHKNPAVWVSEGKPTLINRVFSGMVGKRGVASITFEIPTGIIKKPSGIKKIFGRNQRVIEQDVIIPDDVIIRKAGE